MSKTINENSPVSLLVMAAVVIAIFTVFVQVEPSFKQIDVNTSEIKSNRSDIDSNKSDQREILKHMIQVSGALQRIEGRLEPRVSQGR